MDPLNLKNLKTKLRTIPWFTRVPHSELEAECHKNMRKNSNVTHGWCKIKMDDRLIFVCDKIEGSSNTLKWFRITENTKKFQVVHPGFVYLNNYWKIKAFYFTKGTQLTNFAALWMFCCLNWSRNPVFQQNLAIKPPSVGENHWSLMLVKRWWNLS